MVRYEYGSEENLMQMHWYNNEETTASIYLRSMTRQSHAMMAILVVFKIARFKIN